MATTAEDLCPLCLYNWHDVARPAQCEHRFCFDCIGQGAENKAECPDCRRRARIIQHLLGGQPLEEDARGKAQGKASQEERGASRQHQGGNWDAETVGGLHAMDWGRLFQKHPHLLQLLRPWLQQELDRIFEEEHPLALMLEEMVLGALPVYGLHEGHLVEVLRPNMGICTIVFVQGFIKFTAEQLRRPAHQLLLQDERRAASTTEDSPGDLSRSAVFTWRRDSSPEATTSWAAHQESREGNDVARSTSAGFYKRGELCLVSTTGWVALQGGWQTSPRASSSSTAIRGGCQRSPRASPSPTASRGATPAPQPAPSSTAAAAEAKELQWEPGEAAAGASAPSRGRGRSSRGPRRPLKRKAGSSQDSAVPTKKPPHRQC